MSQGEDCLLANRFAFCDSAKVKSTLYRVVEFMIQDAHFPVSRQYAESREINANVFDREEISCPGSERLVSSEHLMRCLYSLGKSKYGFGI